MSPARALALIEPVLSALAAAHRAGLIHRDVKPENVLIADDGRVKVADFGLAQAVSADTQHTATGGVLIGTVSYLAPELVVDGRADARADVYAAGVVLYELLTGAKPHEGETPIQVAYKHVHEDVPAAVAARARHPGVRRRARRPRHRPRPRACARPTPRVLLHQVHRVSHALAEGVLDDPDLTADLTPLLHARRAGRRPRSTRPTRRADPFDSPGVRRDARAGRGRPSATAQLTPSTGRPPAAPPSGPPRRRRVRPGRAAAPRPGAAAGRAAARRRHRRRRLVVPRRPLHLDPGRARADEAPPSRARRRRPRGRVGRQGLLRDRGRRPRGRHRPRARAPGARRRHGHRSRCRWARSATTCPSSRA